MPLPQSTPGDDARPAWCAGSKVTETPKALLWPCLNDDPTCPSRLVLHASAETPVQSAVTLRHLNRGRKGWGLNRGKGRPRRASAQKKSEPQGHLVQVTPSLSCVGVHVFAAWRQHHGSVSEVMPLLQQAMHAESTQHPEEDVPLLHHQEDTRVRRLQARALQRPLTHGLSSMLLRHVVIAHFSRPPWGPIRPWESPPLTCRPLGHQSAALVPAWSWTRPGSAAHGGLLR